MPNSLNDAMYETVDHSMNDEIWGTNITSLKNEVKKQNYALWRHCYVSKSKVIYLVNNIKLITQSR